MLQSDITRAFSLNGYSVLKNESEFMLFLNIPAFNAQHSANENHIRGTLNIELMEQCLKKISVIRLMVIISAKVTYDS